MIEKLESGKWYRWTGPKKRQPWMNSEGDMDFILDGLPHKCKESADGIHASFYDSADPTWFWKWGRGMEMEYIEEVPEPTKRSNDMENGTVIWKDEEGCLWEGVIDQMRGYQNFTSGLIGYKHKSAVIETTKAADHPEPFNDGQYLHYTRFHPQLKDMIGTEGYFYDVAVGVVGVQNKRPLYSVDSDGFPRTKNGDSYAHFAVSIEKPKTKLTMDEIAEKFGIPIDELVISKGDDHEGN